MKEKNLPRVIVVFVFFVLSFVAGLKAQSIDNQMIRVGLLFGQDFTTLRAQSFSGHWKATFYPFVATDTKFVKPPSEPFTEMIAEGEDLAVNLTRKSILAKLSSGKDFNHGYDKIILEGGELLNIEIPGFQPILLHGALEIYPYEGSLGMVNTLSIRQMVVSSVSKAGSTSEIEALKAFVVVARTRLAFLKQKPLHPDRNFDVCDEEHCLTFSGAGYNRELVDILVTMTANKILEYKGKTTFPRFHHTCGGKISSAKDLLGIDDEPYHVAIEDRIDSKGSENCFHSPGFHWSVELSKLDLLDFISLSWAGGADRIYSGWEPLVIDNNGRISRVVLRGRRPREITGIEFYQALQSFFGPNSLKSMRFSMEVQRRSVIFRGMGQGLGVGMCLFGADGLAKKGKKFDEILGFYYPGTEIK